MIHMSVDQRECLGDVIPVVFNDFFVFIGIFMQLNKDFIIELGANKGILLNPLCNI